MVAAVAAPSNTSGNPSGIALSTRVSMVVGFGVGTLLMVWLFHRARRAGLVISPEGVEVRNSLRTIAVSTAHVVGAVPWGPGSVAIQRVDGTNVAVNAIHRPSGSIDALVHELNAAIDQQRSPADAAERAQHHTRGPEITSPCVAEETARSVLSPIECKLFSRTVSFAVDQSRRPSTKLGTTAARGGLMCGVYTAIANQLTLIMGVVGYGIVCVEAVGSTTRVSRTLLWTMAGILIATLLPVALATTQELHRANL